MTRAKAFKYLSILLIVSFLILAVSLMLKKSKPELYLEARREDPVELAMAEYRLMDELKIAPNEVESATKNERGVYTWAAASILPDFHKADLTIFRGRSRGEHALDGITVFLDAGNLQEAKTTAELNPPAAEAVRKNVAPTDPVSGLPVSPYASKKSDDHESAETALEDKKIAQKDLLPQLSRMLKDELEKMGAEVIMLPELADSSSEVSQAAVIASNLSNRFLEELKAQKFKSPPIEKLVPFLYKANASPDSPEARRVFTEKGVGPELRLLLDLEKQYKDVFLLSLRLGEDEKASGARLRYYGNSVAAGEGCTALLEDRPHEQPAYVAYESSARRRLAEKLEANIKKHLPELSYQGPQASLSESDFPGARYNNLTAVELIISETKNVDNMAFISQENNLKSLAESIALSCYQFYCGD